MSEASALIRKSPIEKIEEAIVGFLKQGGLSSKYLIQAFPEDPDEFDLGDAEKVALVQYTGSRYAAPEARGSGQMRAPEFAIHLYLRSVGKPIRAPFEIDQIRLALQDQSVQGANLYVTRDGLVDQTGSLWRFLIEVACTPIPAVGLPRQRPAPFMTDFSKTEGA
ncbi:Gp37 family protein [Planktotalea sp.]|uniref:Gp37 family protein n=1 Tax=Planktotalea sp. TaxID=2029877 RepID=UPI003D6B0729